MKSASVGVLVNFCVAATKRSVGFLGHSFALIADGLESAGDVITGLVVYIGLNVAEAAGRGAVSFGALLAGHGDAEARVGVYQSQRKLQVD